MKKNVIVYTILIIFGITSITIGINMINESNIINIEDKCKFFKTYGYNGDLKSELSKNLKLSMYCKGSTSHEFLDYENINFDDENVEINTIKYDVSEEKDVKTITIDVNFKIKTEQAIIKELQFKNNEDEVIMDIGNVVYEVMNVDNEHKDVSLIGESKTNSFIAIKLSTKEYEKVDIKIEEIIFKNEFYNFKNNEPKIYINENDEIEHSVNYEKEITEPYNEVFKMIIKYSTSHDDFAEIKYINGMDSIGMKVLKYSQIVEFLNN